MGYKIVRKEATNQPNDAARIVSSNKNQKESSASEEEQLSQSVAEMELDENNRRRSS